MLLVLDGIRYLPYTPRDEEKEFQPLVKALHKEIFGQTAFYFDVRHKLKTQSGIVSIPDAYVLDPATEEWFVVEAELSSHPIYDHVVKQLTKFIKGIEEHANKEKILESIYQEISSDPVLKANFRKAQKSPSEEIHHVLSKILGKEPKIVIIIDSETEELRDGCTTLRLEPKIIELKTYVRENADSVRIYGFEPVHEFNSKIRNDSCADVEPRNKPFKIVIENDEIEVKHYKDILVEAAEWLIKKQKLSPNEMPVVFGRRYLVNREPKHEQGEFKAPLKLSNGLYLETHYSADYCIKAAKFLLDKYGYANALKIEYM